MMAKSIRMRMRAAACRAMLSTAAILVAAGFLTTAYCQETAALKGTVVDSTGAVVRGAHVALKHNATGKLFSQETDEDGFFEVRQLPVGQYVLTVEARGFETWEKTIEAGAKPAGAMLIRMKVAQVNQQVTANAGEMPSALDNLDYMKLDQTNLQRLPILEGDPLAIPSLFLEPAVMGGHGPQLIVDGVEEGTLDLPTSAIKEIFVNKSPYSPKFARPGKGHIAVTTIQRSRHHYR